MILGGFCGGSAVWRPCSERIGQGMMLGHRGNIDTFEDKGLQGQPRFALHYGRSLLTTPPSLSIIACCVRLKSVAKNTQNMLPTGIPLSPALNPADATNFRANLPKKLHTSNVIL